MVGRADTWAVASRGAPTTGFASASIPYIGTNGTITAEFNQVINKGTLRAQLYNEWAGRLDHS